jgi:hypothetical protein
MATFRQVGAALSVHHTVITRAWERYQLHGTPARRHAGGRQRVITPAQDRCLVVQARRARFSTATSLWNDLANTASRRYVEDCMQVVCSREDLTYPPWRVDIARPVCDEPWSKHGGQCNTGNTFSSLMSPGSAFTSQKAVLESGEDEVNGFRMQILLSITFILFSISIIQYGICDFCVIKFDKFLFFLLFENQEK